MTTQDQAETDIFTILQNGWQAGASAIIGYTPEILWPDAAVKKHTPDQTKAYVRVTVANDTEKQVTLGRPAKFQTAGLLYVQIFVPPTFPRTAREKLSQLAELVKGLYVGSRTPNGVWFLNTLVKMMPAEPNWFSRRVQTRYYFEYFSVN